MKTRNGFVSNSSSSSFVCTKCGRLFEGWDGDYGDVSNITCQYGHNFCSSCVKIPEKEMYEYKQEFSAEYCPICSLKMVTDSDALRYLMYEGQINKEDVLERIKNTFGTYRHFRDYMRGIK